MNSNTIDDAAFDEFLKTQNITPAPEVDEWADFDPVDTTLSERLGTRISDTAKEASSKYQTSVNEAEARKLRGDQGVLSTAFQKSAASARAGVSTALSPVTSAVGEGMSKVGDLISRGREIQKANDDQAIADGIITEEQALSRQPHFEDQLKSLIGTLFETGKPIVETIGKNLSPEVKGNLEAVGDLGGAFFDVGSAMVGGKVAKDVVTQGIKTAVKETPAMLKAGKEKAGAIKTSIKNAGKDRTTGELSLLTEAEMKTMTASERAQYVKMKKEGIASTADAQKQALLAEGENLTKAERIAKDNLNRKLAEDTLKAKEEIKSLQKEVGNVAANKTEALKPKVIEGIKKQSQTYSKIVEAEIAPLKNTYVDDREIMASIRKQFPNDPYSPDPYKADRLIKELGLSEGSTQKIGEIYDRAKAVKSTISSSGKTGAKTFSSADMEAIDKVSILNKALSDAGVDLSKANDFWRSWAPVRDQLVKTMRPFDVTGTKGGTFAKTLQRVAEDKADKFNKEFIKQVEDLIGEPITAEAKLVASKLTAAQKKKIAQEMQAVEDQVALRIAKEEGMSKVKSKMSEVESAAAKTSENLDLAAYNAKIVAEQAEARSKYIKKVLGVLAAGVGLKFGYDASGAVLGR